MQIGNLWHRSVREIIVGGLLLAAAATIDVAGQVAPTVASQPAGFNRPQWLEQRDLEYLRSHTDAAGNIRADLWRQGIEDTKRMRIATSISSAPSAAAAPSRVQVFGVAWQQIGPAPAIANKDATLLWSGEVTDIAIDPRNSADQIIYISANDGGIWKSTDGGKTWAPKTDSMPSLSMGAVALDAANPSIVYAGTGNEFNNGFFKGIGIYTSLDGGETWTVHNPNGIFTGTGIARIVSPAANVVIVGTQKGLFRSMDGGLNFGSSPDFNDGAPVLPGNISDLKLDTASPSTTVLAAVNGVGIFRSIDGGATFPANILSAANTTPAIANFGHIDFDLSTTPDNQTLYANLEDTRPQTSPTPRPAPFPFLGLYKSVNGGATWTRMAGADASGKNCFCFYSQTVGVDPQDANQVYLGFIGLYRSQDGGASFAYVSGPAHDDNHAITFSPRSHWASNPNRKTTFYVGNDGGFATSTNGATNVVNLNNGLATLLFRFMDIGRGSVANNTFSYGGLQDMGTIVRHSGAPGFPGLEWQFNNACCDGFGIAVATDPNIAFCSRNGGYNRTLNGGDTWSSPAGNGLPAVFLFAADPNNGSVVYATSDSSSDGCTAACFFSPGSQLWQSIDGGATFILIKTFPSAITALAPARGDSGTFWVGLANGTLQRTANAFSGAGATWVPVTVTGGPGLRVGGLAIDPDNTAQVVVVFEGITGTISGRTKHAFQTADYGTNWMNISGTTGGDPTQNLPDLPLNSVVIDPGTSPHTIIVASDAAVMRTSDGGASWQVLGAFLPTVQCTSLALDTTATPSLLRVGTYGRSVFELTVTNLARITVPGVVFFADTCVGATNLATLDVCNTGTADLEIGPITSSDPQFTVVRPSSGYPVVISPDFCFPFQVRFAPTGDGPQSPTFIIPSNDPLSPTNSVQGFGTGVTPRIATAIADNGNFGDVCLGAFKDLDLTINNSGGCDLLINNITSTSSQFLVPGVIAFPLVLHQGDSLRVPVRFQPTSGGAKTGIINILSNDPNRPITMVAVFGNAPSGSIRVTGSTDFGDVCAGALAEKTLRICNVGSCDLHVSSVAFVGACPDFTIINSPFPATVSPGSCLDLVIRLTPTSCGPKSCLLVITTDDPGFPIINLAVTANTPCPAIDVPPDLGFAPEVIQSIGACTEALPFPISNDGQCNLTITAITIGGANPGDFRLSGLPSFPIILQPGHIAGEGDLNVVFAPTKLDRQRQATITVTYVTDPVSGGTTSVTRKLCGEGVNTGARVLVTASGIPLAKVESIHLQRINANRNKPILDTQDVAHNLPMVTVVPAAPCEPFQYHREYGTVSNPIQLLPGSYQVTVRAIVKGKHRTIAVGFNVDTCGFNANIVVGF